MLPHSPGSTISTLVLAIGDNDLPEIPDDVPDPTTLIVFRNATVLAYTTDFTASIVSVDGAVFLLTVNLVTPAAANDNFLLQLAITFDAMEKQWYQFVKISGTDAAGTRSALGMAAADLDDQLDALADAIDAGGSGAFEYSDVINSSVTGDPVDGVDVWLVATGTTTPHIDKTTTNALGQFTVRTDTAGDYDLLVQETGYTSRRVPITIT